MPEKGDELQRRALDEPRGLTLHGLADALGVSVHTLESYRLRRREMPPEIRKRLASYLRKKANNLRKIGEDLDRSAE